MTEPRVLYLCAGPQSSGSTLVSWCFLQRADMDGILDARNDVLPKLEGITSPLAWCKVTISSFRLREMAAHYEDEGWRVQPILVVRDVRAVFNSLMTKNYGRNGVTAEEPPLRMRLRRFKDDWHRCRDLGQPVVRFETLVSRPEETLRLACQQSGLAWDDGMMNWPKGPGEIFAPGHGNPTFRKSRGRCMRDTVNPSLAVVRTEYIPPDDLAWVEREFADYNRAMEYAEHIPARGQLAGVAAMVSRAVPRWENTRRHYKRQPIQRITNAVLRFSAQVARAFPKKKPTPPAQTPTPSPKTGPEAADPTLAH